MSNPPDTALAFDVFISYSRADTAQVDRLVARLRQDGYEVWFDRDQMTGGAAVLRQLAEGISRSAHMIACLSDSYVDRDFTEFELQTNQSLDPANRRNRTIPVVVRTLTKPAPDQIRAFTWVDLTQDESYEREYRRVAAMIGHASASAPAAEAVALELDAETAESLCNGVMASQDDPQVALFKLRLAAESLSRFLFRQEIGAPPADVPLHTLVEQLAGAGKLPPQIHIALATARTYAEFAVRQGAEGQSLTSESIRPGVAALRVLTNWTVATYLRKEEAGDEWDAISSQLPRGDNPDDRLIPGTRLIMHVPRVGVNRLGAVYSGLDGETRQTISLVLVSAAAGDGEAFLDAVARLRGVTEAGVARPVRSGRLLAGNKKIGYFAAFEQIAGWSGSQLIERFGRLPALAACELCRGVAQTLEVLHSAEPPIVYGEVGAEAAVVTRYAAVKLIGMPALAPASVAAPNPATDLEALRNALTGLLAPEDLAVEAVAQLMRLLEQCPSAADARAGLDRACHDLAGGIGLRDVVDCYREGRALPQSAAETPAAEPAPRRPAEFELCFEVAAEAAGAWPAGPGEVLLWDRESRQLALVRDGAVCWRDQRPMRVRRVAQGAGGRCAAAGWDGEVRCFRPGQPPAAAKLPGAIGDLQFALAGWVAGTWRNTLATIGEDGAVRQLPPAIEAGVLRIAVAAGGDLFGVADLAGGIWLYSAGRRVASVLPIARVRDLAYCGNRLVVLAGDTLVWIGQDGAPGAPERIPSGRTRLLRYPAGGGCLLVSEDGTSWTLALSGARLPHHRFPSGALVCDVPKRFVAPDGEGWAYWRDGTAPVCSWPDALGAEISADGGRIAVRLPGKVRLYMDPL